MSDNEKTAERFEQLLQPRFQEISRDEADVMLKEGALPVYGQAFDPLQIERFTLHHPYDYSGRENPWRQPVCLCGQIESHLDHHGGLAISPEGQKFLAVRYFKRVEG